MARSVKNNAWNEVFALILLGVGTLLFLALISYRPEGPAFVGSWFSHVSPPNRPAQNFIGPFGAILAGFCYFIIGAASYLLAAVLLGFGGAKLFHPRLARFCADRLDRPLHRSGACLLQLQTRYFRHWHILFNIPGPGGWLGYFLGKTILLSAMGKVGSIVLLGGAYVTQPDPDDRAAPDPPGSAKRDRGPGAGSSIFTNGGSNASCGNPI